MRQIAPIRLLQAASAVGAAMQAVEMPALRALDELHNRAFRFSQSGSQQPFIGKSVKTYLVFQPIHLRLDREQVSWSATPVVALVIANRSGRLATDVPRLPVRAFAYASQVRLDFRRHQSLRRRRRQAPLRFLCGWLATEMK